jgi:hypothetical protein
MKEVGVTGTKWRHAVGPYSYEWWTIIMLGAMMLSLVMLSMFWYGSGVDVVRL